MVVDDELNIMTLAAQEYGFVAGEPGSAEENPDEIVDAVMSTVRDAVAQLPLYAAPSIRAVVFSTVLHSMMILDDNGERLTGLITWADVRSADDARRLREAFDPREFYARTGCPLHSVFLPAKIAWLKQREPEVWRRSRFIASIKEYVIYRLTGKLVCDQSVASGTGLMNIYSREWDRWILDSLGLEEGGLGTLVTPFAIVGDVSSDVARQWGLKAGTPIVIGGGDAALSNLGAGAVGQGSIALMVGTSSAIRTVTRKPMLDPMERTWCYYLAEDNWIVGGASNSGGNVLRWFRDGFDIEAVKKAMAAGMNPYDALSAYASEVPAGSNGLLFLPFLSGERSPGWQADARGIMVGLSLQHGVKHMVRAGMEGAAFQLYSIFEVLQELCGELREIRASGGFTKSDVWLQIMADVFGREISVPAVREGSAIGAAMIAMVATGRFKDFKDMADRAADIIKIERLIEPQPPVHRLYMDIYEQYKAVYSKLKDQFSPIAALAAQAKR